MPYNLVRKSRMIFNLLILFIAIILPQNAQFMILKPHKAEIYLMTAW